MSTVPLVGSGKREAPKKWSKGITCKGSTRYRNYLEDYWPCAGGLSAVNAIGTHLLDPINSWLTRWRLMVYEDAVGESERNPMSKHQIDDWWLMIDDSDWVKNERADAGRGGRMSRSTKFSSANRDREKYAFPVKLTTSRIGNLPRLNVSLLKCKFWPYVPWLYRLAQIFGPKITPEIGNISPKSPSSDKINHGITTIESKTTILVIFTFDFWVLDVRWSMRS